MLRPTRLWPCRPSRRAAAGGMTLVEIMIVVIVMALIATGVAWAVVPTLVDGKARQAAVEVRTLAGAVSLYMMQHSEECPADLGSLALSASARDRDPWGNAFRLDCFPGEEPVVSSPGADGLEGTGDDLRSDASAELE